jgi:phenylacetate-coenzyme A ligase PaaK-like adenylate-forming protein
LIGYHRANAYTLGKEDCLRIARLILRVRPVGIIGYAAALDLFARHAAGMREDLRAAGVRFVITTAEPPPRADTFDLLRDLFGECAIIEEFGGVEFGQLGVRIDAGQWQTFPDLNILEATEPRDEPDGHSLLVTTLYRRYVPFVRYRQGDLVDGPRRLEHGQLIGFDSLAGRSADMVTMSDGRSVHSVAFFHCIHQEPAVLNIQMVIADEGSRLKLVVSGPVDPGFEPRIRHRLKQVHPLLESAPLEYVQDLATNVAGKRRWYVDQRTK